MQLRETRCRSGVSYPVEAGDAPSLFLTYKERNAVGDVQDLPEQQPDTALALMLL